MCYIFIVYELINMLDSDWCIVGSISDWCIVGSMTTVMTLDVKLEWTSISDWLNSPHQEI